jgi:hypothetical protein
MGYTGGLGAYFRTHRQRATDAALRASAQVIVNGLKEKSTSGGLAEGYTSGAFVTGTLLNSIFISEPFTDAGGKRFRLIGTNLAYAVYWEVGHYNIFTRRYEREERWRPTLLRKYDEAVAAYHRAYALEINR